jgi:hypothetical protein
MRSRREAETRLRLPRRRRRRSIVAAIHRGIVRTRIAIPGAGASTSDQRGLLAVRVTRRWLRGIATEYVVLVEERHGYKGEWLR